MHVFQNIEILCRQCLDFGHLKNYDPSLRILRKARSWKKLGPYEFVVEAFGFVLVVGKK